MPGVQDLSDADLMALAKPAAAAPPASAIHAIPDEQLLAMAKPPKAAPPRAEQPDDEADPSLASHLYQIGRGAITGGLGAPADMGAMIYKAIRPPEYLVHTPELPENYVGGSKWIGDRLDQAQNAWDRARGGEEIGAPPKGPLQRFLNAAGTGIGGVIGPLAGIKAASRALPAAETGLTNTAGQAVRATPGIEGSAPVNAVTDFFRNPSLGTVARETGLGAVSGGGADIASEAAPGNPLAPLAGGIAAPLAVVGPAALAGGAMRAAQRARAPFGEPGRREIAGNVLRESAWDRGAVAAEGAPPPIAGQRPTLAQERGDPGIAGLEQAADVLNPQPFKAQRSANNQAIRDAAAEVSEGDPAAIRAAVQERQRALTGAADRGEQRAAAATQETADAAAQRRAGLAAQHETAAGEAGTATQQAVEGAAPGAGVTDKNTSAENLHRDIMSQYKASENAEREAWAPINEVKGLKFDTAPIKEDIKAAVDAMPSPDRAAIPDNLLAMIKAWGGSERFHELTSIKSAFNSAARTARQSGDANGARVIGQVEDVLAKHLDNPALLGDALEGEPNAIKEAYDNARRVTREQKQQFNTASETAPLFQRTGTGDVRIAPTETMGQFVKAGPGGKEAFQSLVKALGGPEVLTRAQTGDATALNHVRDWAIADIQAKPLTAANVATWRDKYSGMLSEFPQLRGDIDRIGSRALAQETAEAQRDAVTKMVADVNSKELTPKAIDALKAKHADVLNANPEIKADLDAVAQRVARQEQTTARRKSLTDMLEKNAANHFMEGDPDYALGQLFKSKNLQANDQQVSQFMRFIKKSPEAAEGARRTMVDMLTRSGENEAADLAGDKMLAAPKMVKFYEKNSRVFDALFPNAEQRALLDRIVEGVKMNGPPGAGTGTVGSNTANKLAGVERMKKLSGDKYIDALVGGGASKLMGLLSAGVGSLTGHGVIGGVVGMAEGPKIFKGLYAKPREQVMDLVHEALRDPALARDLMREATPRNDKIVGPRLARYLGAATVPAGAAAAEDADEE